MSKAQAMVDFAIKQIGTIGGDKIRKWYNENVLNIGNYKWPWCAAGVSYCASNCGLTDIIKPCASCSMMVNRFRELGQFKKASNYIAKAGDLIFFKWTNTNSVADHVGIVEKVSGSYVHTIEFNSGSKSDGEVARWKYLMTSVNILGYAVPNYPNDTVKIINHKSYIRSQAWYDKKYQSSKVLKALEIGDKVQHISDDNYGWSKVKSGNVTGYIQNTRLDKKGLSTYRKAIVNVDIMVVDLSGEKKLKFNKNTKVTFICSIEKGKYKGVSIIRYNKVTYYIKTKYLNVQ